MVRDAQWDAAREAWNQRFKMVHKIAKSLDPRVGAWAAQVAPWHRLSDQDIVMMADFMAAVEVGRVKQQPNGKYEQRSENVLDGFIGGM